MEGWCLWHQPVGDDLQVGSVARSCGRGAGETAYVARGRLAGGHSVVPGADPLVSCCVPWGGTQWQIGGVRTWDVRGR